jgi:hypothetical protein
LVQDQSEKFDSFDKLVATVDEDTENAGVIMYFGDARRRNKSLVEFREKVIEQVIVALLVLQQKGNLLLKVRQKMN